MLSENVFLKIINKEIPAKLVFEDELCLAFHDIAPKAPIHVIVIPRKVISTHDDIVPEDAVILGHMHLVAARIAADMGLTSGYRLVINCKESGGQTVPHLHMHLLGGRDLSWPPG